MIPIRLYISGFLSYREPVEIDFTSFDLACIAGPNGAGKSSLLDAITWALFGQARKRDDSLIHSRSSVAEVRLVFAYESNLYTVRRIKPRDKTMLLEFQIWQDQNQPLTTVSQPAAANSRQLAEASRQIASGEGDVPGQWRPLTERTLRETELRILQTLRMDYETFINASFFLQGKADQFTQQRPGDRKRILGSILGLEIWESYRQRAAERRKLVESDITEPGWAAARDFCRAGRGAGPPQPLAGAGSRFEAPGRADAAVSRRQCRLPARSPLRCKSRLAWWKCCDASWRRSSSAPLRVPVA